MAKKSSSKDSFVVDFSKEEEGGGSKRFPEGDYVVKIVGAKLINSKDKGTPGLELKMKLREPEKFRGKPISENLWLTPKALGRVRSLLELCGIDVPKKKAKIPFKALIGQEVGITIEDDTYETNDGKKRTRSTVAYEFLDPEVVRSGGVDEDDEEEEDTDEDVDEDEDTDDEDEDDDDVEDLDVDDDDL